jgi:hypothetical protein
MMILSRLVKGWNVAIKDPSAPGCPQDLDGMYPCTLKPRVVRIVRSRPLAQGVALEVEGIVTQIHRSYSSSICASRLNASAPRPGANTRVSISGSGLHKYE